VILVEAKNLTQRFGENTILTDVNLKVSRKEAFVIIGPTGAGKTTLLRILDLLDRPSAGSIAFSGIDITSSKRLRQSTRRRISFVQQKPIVFHMNVYDNVACGLRWRGVKETIIREKVMSVLELVAMHEYKDRNAKTLSGGETQRVAVARALVTDPEMILLDEPTANLDPISASKIEEVLTHVITEKKTTMIMATHDMSQGQRLADRIGVMIAGRMLQVGSPREIFISPQTREIAEFVGVENILPGIVTGRDGNLANIEVEKQNIEAISAYHEGERVYVLVRPEDITLSLSGESSSARNNLVGRIVKMVSVEPLVRIEVDCGFHLLALITNRSSEEMGLTIGKKVYCSIKASAISIIKRW